MLSGRDRNVFQLLGVNEQLLISILSFDLAMHNSF